MDPVVSPAVASTIADVRSRVAGFRKKRSARVGFVPTMGFFHEGHLSLMRAARSASGLVVVSIFVNPRQFGADEDLESYPRDFDRDLALAGAEGVDLVFTPSPEEMYPEGYETTIDAGSVAAGLCGQDRPGHFQAVATVVAKFFNIIRPDTAWFGQKDAQQVAVIKRMAQDLDYDVEIGVCPIAREDDGLAMSSRNSYLKSEEREQATVLYRALTEAGRKVAAGETSASRIRRLMRKTIAANYLVELEYARVVDPVTMQPVQEIHGEVLAAVAARVGRARLIDNMILKPEEN